MSLNKNINSPNKIIKIISIFEYKITMNEKFIFFIIFSINCYLIRCINATENAEIIEGILIGGEEYIK